MTQMCGDVCYGGKGSVLWGTGNGGLFETFVWVLKRICDKIEIDAGFLVDQYK